MKSSCCKELFCVRKVGEYGIQYCSGCGRLDEDRNRSMFAKMMLVSPSLYEEARGVVSTMIEEQRLPLPPPKKSSFKKGKPLVFDYVDTHPKLYYYGGTTTSTTDFCPAYTFLVKKNR